jgi:glutamate 5-kinase
MTPLNKLYRDTYIRKSRRIVLKLGTKVLLTNCQDINKNRIMQLVEDIAFFRGKGYEFTIVSSGAVGFGMNRFGLDQRPTALNRIQALASVGQCILMERWSQLFNPFDIRVGQILLTYDIIEDRQRFLHARECLKTLLDYNAIPIVNENDSVAVEELKFGDNDILSALTANLMEADLLILFTNTDGVFDKNPHKHPDAKIISLIEKIDDETLALIEDKHDPFSVGGMQSKLRAAQLSAQCGTGVVITSGETPRLKEILEGETVGTFIKPEKSISKKRKKWIFFNQKIHGRIIVDRGAEKALVNQLKSLLPGGVLYTEEKFSQGSIIGIYNSDNKMIAKGISKFSSDEIEKIKGHRTDEIASILGRESGSEIVHRDDMIIL